LAIEPLRALAESLRALGREAEADEAELRAARLEQPGE
jgi:hypothetical protein